MYNISMFYLQIIQLAVLLILAGVTIATLTGENGILTRASDAAEQTEIAEEKEAIGVAYTGVLADNNGRGVSASELQEELEKNGYNATVTDNRNGTYTVKFESGREYTINADGSTSSEPGTGGGTEETIGKTDGSYDEEKGVNTPKIDTENGMQLVKYDESTQEWIEDTTNSSYSYVAQTGSTENGGKSEWANAKVTIDGVESYFVWIPRFAYKIDSASQTIDVKFLKNTGTEATDGTKCKYADDSSLNTSTDYIIHPVFTTNADLGGGWDTELPGLWIGKYESSLVNKADSNYITTSSTTIGNILLSENTDKAIAVQPNMSSWRYCTIGNMYTNARAYSPNLNSHMLKNSEWGAVAYLTHSQYGRNGTEVTINNNSSYLTGNAGDSVSASSSAITNAYNTEKGVIASSTVNVYGIYDLSGGAHEYVAGYYNGSTSNSLTNYGGSFASNGGASTKYATAYTGTTSESSYKYGDATYETSGWNGDNAGFVDWDFPFFTRGGLYSLGSRAGVFDFYFNYGDDAI